MRNGLHAVRRAALVVGMTTTMIGAGLPARALAAESGAVTGVVQDVIVDAPRHAPGADDEVRRVLRVGDDVIPLTEGSLPTADNGDTVKATLAPAGASEQRVLSASTVAEAPDGTQPVVAPRGGATVHDVYAAIVTPKGLAADPAHTAAAVKAAVDRASSYWSSQTDGAVSFRVAGVTAYTSAVACTPSGGAEGKMWNEALGRMDVPAGSTRHLMVVAPRKATAAGCAYGLGTIKNWYRKPALAFVSAANQSLVAHELGHNLGLYHSGAVRCPSTQDAAYVAGTGFAGCRAEEYGDVFDVMGYSGPGYGEGSLNAVQLDLMGQLPTAVHTVEGAGTHTVRIAPMSAAPTATRVIRVTEASGETYYVEYRVNAGRDAASAANAQRPALGVRVLRGNPAADGGSVVLDATPTGAVDDYAHSLAVGRTFTSASRGLTVTVQQADAAGATIVLDTGASVPANAVLSGLPTRANVGAAMTARMVVRNAHGQPVPNWNVSLQKLARGTASYATFKTLRTDANGVASFRFGNGVAGHYRFVTAAGTDAPATISNSSYVTSQAVVGLRRPATSIRRGGTLAVTGTVAASAGSAVYVQAKRGNGAWSTVRASVSGTKVSGRVKLAGTGTYQVRLYVAPGASGRHLADVSAAYPVRTR